MLKTIKLLDGIDVEVEVEASAAHEISRKTDLVNSSISQLQDFLSKVVKPISETYLDLSDKIDVSEVKVTLGVKFGLEGNFILAKSSTEANIQVEMVMRKKNA
ncbi:CU044_2847 family protein [Shewanella baltica]|uniref:CU044_2847 family protein n=1 Tax=Shewanella baltica TaxID=62322 RepID=UPI0024BBC6B5|nr:CU044_2847 family protein [Shewanella baltica]